MSLAVDRLHARVVRSRVLAVFTAITRVLLALAFLPSGLVKALGQRFTTLPVTDPVGYFFDGFFSAAGYYQFVGIMQLTAATLLLLPWTATLGAVVYLPIIVNIFVITVSVGFGGTAVITGLMLLGNIYLLCWDYDRWRDLLPRRSDGRHLGLASTLAFSLSALAGLIGVTRLHLARLRHDDMILPSLLVIVAAPLLAFLMSNVTWELGDRVTGLTALAGALLPGSLAGFWVSRHTARRLDRGLRLHAEHVDVEEHLQHRLALHVSAGRAERHVDTPVLERERGIGRQPRPLARRDRRGVSRISP